MKRTSIAAALAAAALGLAGCATAEPPGATAGAGAMTGAAPLDAAIVTPAFGWVLTADQLLVSRDGGATLSPVDVPVPAGGPRAAFFADERTGVVAAATAETITVARTTNGGRSWQTAAVAAPSVSAAGYADLAVSFGDASHGAILARAATSQAFSLGTVLATTDGGASWAVHAAPEAGRLHVDPGGRIWLASAVLQSSTDLGQTWTRSELSLAPAAPGAATAVGPPVAGTVPVTVTTGERTEVQLLTSTDGGHTWGQAVRLPARGRTGPGVRLAVAATASGPVVFDTASGHAYRRDGTDLRPAGLSEGVHTVTFSADGRYGWALAGHGSCAAGKQGCTYRDDLLTTTDGGTTWTTAASWTHPA
jgi:photosystem II stability/assembly factor-like uncharacterized protein